MSPTDYLLQSVRAARQNNINKRKNEPNEISVLPKFPCSICNFEVKHNDRSILCTACDLWVHIKCNGISVNEYIERQQRNRDNPELVDNELWSCMTCILKERSAYVPFIYLSETELNNLNTIDSMKLLDLLPCDEVHNDALSINQLILDDDDDIIDNINCKYTCDDFLNLNRVQFSKDGSIAVISGEHTMGIIVYNT